MARRGRPPNRVTKRVVDYGDPNSVGDAIAAIQDLDKGMIKAEIELGKLADHIQALFLNRLLAELAVYPPRQKGMKIRWKSVKQRIKVMIILRKQAEERLGRKLRKGDDISYVRTGTFGDSWFAEAVPQKKGLRIRVENLAENEEGVRYQKFVTGAIGLGQSRTSMRRYDKPMQPFHKDRGWNKSQPIIARYIRIITEYANDEFERQLDQLARELAA